MSDDTELSQSNKSLTIGCLIAALLFLGLAFLLWRGLSSSPLRLLKPTIATETPNSANNDGQSIQVSFTDLQAMPRTYHNLRIQVTGDYTQIALPDCLSFSGPPVRWGLIGDSLQMNGIGLESILRLVPSGTTLTVEGIWRLYRGPSGCGKEPEVASVWYLDIERILKPNPLPDFDTQYPIVPPLSENGTIMPIETAVTNAPTPDNGSPNAPTATRSSLTTPTIVPTQLSTIGATEPPLSATETAVSAMTVSPTSSPSENETAVATSTRNGNTATPTPTASVTPTIDPAATPTSGSQLPPINTATPSDPYPSQPTNTPASTATPTPVTPYP